jgi:hypothetical protein
MADHWTYVDIKFITQNNSYNNISKVWYTLDCGYNGPGTDTTQQSGQTPDKEVDIKHFTVILNPSINTTISWNKNIIRCSGLHVSAYFQSHLQAFRIQTKIYKNAHSMVSHYFTKCILKLNYYLVIED